MSSSENIKACNDMKIINTELESISKVVENCDKCELAKTRIKTVFGKGSHNPLIVFVGEAPGAEEDKTGMPFVGRGGRLLDTWLSKYNLNLDMVYIMNAIKCRPPKNRDPLPSEKEACRFYFEKQIELLKPKVLCGLGRHGFGNLVSLDSKLAYGKMRGIVHHYKNIPVIATYHPAYILRSSKEQEKVFEDFQLLLETLKNNQ